MHGVSAPPRYTIGQLLHGQFIAMMVGLAFLAVCLMGFAAAIQLGFNAGAWFAGTFITVDVLFLLLVFGYNPYTDIAVG